MSEGPTNVAIAIAPYVAIVAAVGFVLYWFDKKFNIGASITEVAKMADNAAENYGEQKAAATTSPEVEYDSARSAYAKLIKWDIATQGLTIPGWPTRPDWLNGDGPGGFTYGSPNYPGVPGASVIKAIESVF